jgi:hypothetical protein
MSSTLSALKVAKLNKPGRYRAAKTSGFKSRHAR